MQATEIWQMSASDQAAAIRDGTISAVEAVEAAIARKDAANGAVNAVVVDLREEALAAAREADARRAKGEPLGALHGVPVTIKINVDYVGQANSNGVPALANLIAKEDSPIVRHWRNAGAIAIGMTNTPEFSMRAMTDNPLHGLTLNPWDPAATCGGSSGGAASSVALGIGALAHGNDIGGSLRWPALACGVSTIKPTTGRVPAFNATAGGERPMLAQITSSQGPIAREVKDVRLGLQAMIGRDPRDPWHVPLPFDGPALDGPIKVAIAEVPDGYPVHDAVLAAVEEAARMLADAGYVVERVKTPDIARPLELWFDLIPAEMREMQLDAYRKMATPEMNAIVDAYIGLCHAKDLKGFMAASAERTGHIRNWMLFLERYPLVLTPLCLQPSHAADADLKGPEAVDGLFRSFVFQTGLNTLALPCAVVPTGLHEGRPLGIQLVASRFREDVALAAAEAIEARTGVLAERLWSKTV
ncbi:amidase [Enterovirga rhinocerotis]|uniref:Indoleacetamide hydrolase n=1 Tax=Enterovirga rhinocerotis TaxID=1339210 RepID=A0A4R7C1V5_9HYPH|nr:amidase [Enterovirga rhinocerotis]TDR90386.1 amidase [Enterovirga rhinocerotis]